MRHHDVARSIAKLVAVVGLLICFAPGASGDERHRLLTSVDAATTIDSTPFRDRDLAWVGLEGGGAAVGAGLGDVLPPGVGVDALSIVDGHKVVFSTDVSFETGRDEVADEDLVIYDHGDLSLFFDGSAAGIPASVDIDAVHVLGLDPLKILFSVDAATEIDGLAVTDDDVVSSVGGSHTIFLAGATVLGDEAPRADVDGLWYDPSRNEYVISLDVAITETTGRTAAEPDDFVLWANGSLVMFFDASARGVSVPGLDFDAAHVESAMFADGFETGGTTQWSTTNP